MPQEAPHGVAEQAPARRKRRPVLTDQMVEGLKPDNRKRYFHPDPELPMHGIRVAPDGQKSFYVIIRDPWKKQRWVKLGSTAELKIEQAREKAREVIARIKQGKPAFEPPPVRPDTVEDVIRSWSAQHGSKLRTGGEIMRVLERHVIPVCRDRPFVEIGRLDIAQLLDAVEAKHSAWVANSVLSALQGVAFLVRHAARHLSPAVRAQNAPGPEGGPQARSYPER